MAGSVRFFALVVLLVLSSAGCAHQIAFQDIGYKIPHKQDDASVVVVIDVNTLNKTVSIRSFMTGIIHRWDAQPGMMLKQIADIEFPQMFKDYEFVSSDNDSKLAGADLTLHLSVPQYNFANFSAMVTIRAIAYGTGKESLFDKTYTEQGIGQGAKMFFAGAFGMKSAMRQSSFDAYRKIFRVLRADIINVLK